LNMDALKGFGAPVAWGIRPLPPPKALLTEPPKFCPNDDWGALDCPVWEGWLVAVLPENPEKLLSPVGALLIPVPFDDMVENADPLGGAGEAALGAEAVDGPLVLVGEEIGGNDASSEAPNEEVGWNTLTLLPAKPVGWDCSGAGVALSCPLTEVVPPKE